MLQPGLPLEPTVRSRYLSCGETLFDTELSEQARLELERPRRPRLLEGQKPATLNSGAKWPLYLVLLGCALVIGGSLATWRQGQTAERARKARGDRPAGGDRGRRPAARVQDITDRGCSPAT